MSAQTPEQILEQALSRIAASSANAGEVYFQDTTETSVSVVVQRLESAETKQERGFGIRVFRDGKIGFSFSVDTSPEGIQTAVDRAVAVLPHVDAEEANAVPTPEEALPFEPNEDRSLPSLDLESKIDMARRIESIALRFSSRIKRTRESRYTDIHGRCHVANTSGLSASYTLSRAIGFIELLAIEGDENQTGYGSGFGYGMDDLEPDAIGIEAAQRAINKLGAEPITTRNTDVVLDPEVVTGIFGTLSAALYADNVLKNKSLFRDRLEQKIARPTVTLVDDGRIRGGINSAPFDGEGTPTRRNTLIEDGVLKSYLHDSYTAAKMKTSRTGNAQRGSYLSPPRIGTSTLFLRPTGISRKDLLQTVAKGVYISEVMGLHTIDPVTGEFSLGAVGWEMENGELTRPVQRLGISGNILKLLDSVAAVGDDLRLFATGNAGSTLLLEGVSISGT